MRQKDHQGNRESIQCAERDCSSGLYWQGWRAFRTDQPDLGEALALAFCCPVCALER